ncbi:UDP-N-acetyl glucosamine 2-epimerase [Hydrogenophaga soli]|nr:UDP-N-acetylglucosamine 2-epimerase (non-hydrolyzing) [Burkholderiaceae bacterium]
MFPKTHLFCIGTRPEIIKMAPVYRRLKAHGHNVRVLHTGQHGAVADELYTFFGMPPDIRIDLQRQSPSLAHLSVALMNGIEQAMHTLRPDVLLVQGDTSSALVGALVGYYNDVPVAHIEAGLRTGEREPFPEEKNRQLIAQLAHWHFTPTPQCTHNLRTEGVAADRIVEVGNTVIDAAQWTSGRISRADFDLMTTCPADLRGFMHRHLTQRLVLVTAHRRENWGQPIRHIAQALANTLAQHPDVVAVWPVHPNPAVRADVEAVLDSLPASVRVRICLTEPLGYPVLIALLLRCHFALTDSGGIQEEASAFGKPVLIARHSTERQELVQAGGAVLVGTDVDGIHRHATTLLTHGAAYRAMQLVRSPFGDGHSAQRIATTLAGGPWAQVQAPTVAGTPPVHVSAHPVPFTTATV